MCAPLVKAIVLFMLSGVAVFVAKKTSQKTLKAVDAMPVDIDSASGVLGFIDSDSVLDFLPEAKQGATVNLRYFKPEEFGGWFEKMSPELLEKLDEFRHQWGFPVEVSPHADAVGREDADSQSQHNVLKWGEVRAVDVFPKNSIGAYINSKAERQRAYEIAKRVGFTGVGLYVDTKPGNMAHLDVRKAPFAKWSRVAGRYMPIEAVLA